MSHPHLHRVAAVLAILIAAGGLVCGCAATGVVTPSGPMIGMASASARIDVRADTIADMTKQLPEGLPRLVIATQAGGVKADGRSLAAEIEAARVNEKLMAGTIGNQQTELAVRNAELQRLNTLWVAPRLTRAWHWLLAIVVGGWVALGAVSIIAPMVWPVGGLWFSKQIIRFLPLANLFSVFRNAALARTAGLVPGFVSRGQGTI